MSPEKQNKQNKQYKEQRGFLKHLLAVLARPSAFFSPLMPLRRGLLSRHRYLRFSLGFRVLVVDVDHASSVEC